LDLQHTHKYYLGSVWKVTAIREEALGELGEEVEDHLPLPSNSYWVDAATYLTFGEPPLQDGELEKG
jgi:hypothetical protein